MELLMALVLTSPALADGDAIPPCYTCEEKTSHPSCAGEMSRRRLARPSKSLGFHLLVAPSCFKKKNFVIRNRASWGGVRGVRRPI